MIAGGWAVATIEPRHNEVLDNVKIGLNQQLGTNYQTFTIIEVRQQVVAGMNYQFTLETEDNKRLQIKIHQPLPHTNQPPQIKSVAYI